MIEYCGEYFGSTGVQFFGYDELPELTRDDNEDQWMFERLVVENAETYAPYERTDNVFDMTNTKRFAGDIVCPDLDRTVVFRYIEYGNEDRWGKRKPEWSPVRSWSEDRFQSLQAEADNGGSAQTVGLDLLGPGGGQLTVQLSASGVQSTQRGLPDGDFPVLKISASAFEAALNNEGDASQLIRGWDVTDSAVARELTDMLVAAVQPEVSASRT
jgi:hypothetical protein